MTTPTMVYVVEVGLHLERAVQGVASSPDAAVALIRSEYGPPYVITRWGELTVAEWRGTPRRAVAWSLDADFAAVAGYSTKHTAHWTITEYQLDGPWS